jgi:hypothetical protein
MMSRGHSAASKLAGTALILLLALSGCAGGGPEGDNSASAAEEPLDNPMDMEAVANAVDDVAGGMDQQTAIPPDRDKEVSPSSPPKPKER